MHVTLPDAATHLASYADKLERYEEDEVILVQHGVPVAKITRVTAHMSTERIGVASGKFDIPDNFDDNFDMLDSTMEEMFEKA